jgi:hypothetical protein
VHAGLAARPSLTCYEVEIQRIDKLLGIKVPSWTGLNEGAGTAEQQQKVNERTGNVYENKGPLWKTGVEPGMLQKTKAVTR